MNVHNQFEKLTENNYDIWSVLMKSVLVNADLWGITNGQVRNDANTPNWSSLDAKALATIILHVGNSQITHIKRCKSSSEAWKKLETVHRPSGPIRKVSLYKKLLNLRMTEHENVATYISSFSEHSDKLEELDIKLTDEFKTIMLLSSLPSEYDNFVIAIETRDSLPKFESIKTKLLEEGERRNQKEDHNANSSQQAFYAKSTQNQTKTNKKKKFNVKCYNCGKRGHTIEFCRNRGQLNKQN